MTSDKMFRVLVLGGISLVASACAASTRDTDAAADASADAVVDAATEAGQDAGVEEFPREGPAPLDGM